MSDSDTKLHHVYDGIEEHDNHLPNWWLGILWGTIAFAFAYWMYFHVFGSGYDLLAEYQVESAELKRRAASAGPVTNESLVALSQDAQTIGAGQKTFQQNCVACHGQEGQGIVGPNLTDDYWLHGKGGPVDIQKTITGGVVEKGMPSWGPTLGAERIRQVTAYVMTLKGKHFPGKAPQGDLIQ